MAILDLFLPVLRNYITGKSRKSLAPISGTLKTAGLKAPVEILRDRYGVPHIYAQSRGDMFLGQGYVQAQDRLWQLETLRRVASGRLSEFAGPETLLADRAARTLGFRRWAAKDLERYQHLELTQELTQFAAGINAAIAAMPSLPVEFKLLKLKVEPWTLLDVAAIGRFYIMQMSYGWLHEIERMRLISLVGEEKARELFPQVPEQHPPSVVYGSAEHGFPEGGVLRAFYHGAMKPAGASNNWVAAPHKMENGGAVLANDPHLPLSNPNIWHEAHLCCPEVECSGASMVGLPMIQLGHNRHIAWGSTVSFADTQDVFEEQFLDADRRRYRWGDEIREAEHFQEQIIVKGKPAHVEKVVVTHHGPVISDIAGISDRALALQSTSLMEADMVLGYYYLNEAKNWEDFVNAMSHMHSPSLNMVYADKENNIGYLMCGRVPVRQRTQDLTPAPGWALTYDWKGFIPYEEMPHSFNPEKGYVFSCNNKIMDDTYPHDLGSQFMNGYRARRLDHLFQSKEQYSVQDFQQWQVDTYCYPGLELGQIYQTQHEKGWAAELSPAASRALAQLLQWDGYLTKETLGGTVYQVLKQQLIESVFGRQLGKLQTERFKGEGIAPPVSTINDFFGHDTTTLLRALQNENSWWVKQSGGLETTLRNALEQAVVYLTNKLGRDEQTWSWGRLHLMVLHHSFGTRSPLNKVFNLGAYPVAGDTDTLLQSAFMPTTPYAGIIGAASFRAVFVMEDFDKNIMVKPPGNIANMESPFYADQMQLWLDNHTRPMFWSREKVEENTVGKLILTDQIG